MPRIRHYKTTSRRVNGVTYRSTQSRGWFLGPYHVPRDRTGAVPDSTVSPWRFPMLCLLGAAIYGLLQLPWWGALLCASGGLMVVGIVAAMVLNHREA